jgi:hypothetical protein
MKLGTYFFIIIIVGISNVILANAQNNTYPDWVRMIDVNNDADVGLDLVGDLKGNIFMCGRTNRTSTRSDYFVVKYMSSGRAIGSGGDRTWDTISSSNSSSAGEARSIAFNGSSIFVTGTSKVGSYYKPITVKYDTTNLTRQWKVIYGSGNINIEGVSIKAGKINPNYIYVIGNKNYSASLGTLFIEKYDINGTHQIDATPDPDPNAADFIREVAIDPSNDDIYMISCNSANTNMWLVKVNSAINSINYYPQSGLPAISISASGYVDVAVDANYVYLYYQDATNNYVVKIFNKSLVLQTTLTEALLGSNYTSNLYVASNKNIYITTNQATWNTTNTLLIKYQYQGGTSWSKIWQATQTDASIGKKLLLVDNSENIYLASMILGSDGNFSIWKYDANSNFQYEKTFDGFMGEGYDNVKAMAASPNGSNIFITGSTTHSLTGNSDAILYKYDVGGTFPSKINTMPLLQSLKNVPSQYELSQNYPNPFNPNTSIKFVLKEVGFVTLKVYDITGKEVMSLIDSKLYEEGEHIMNLDASFLTSGVYYYRLNIDKGKFNEVKKMVLVK